jgi:hypothetical protein
MYHIPDQICFLCGKELKPEYIQNTRVIHTSIEPIPTWECLGGKIICFSCSSDISFSQKLKTLHHRVTVTIDCPKLDHEINASECLKCDFYFGEEGYIKHTSKCIYDSKYNYEGNSIECIRKSIEQGKDEEISKWKKRHESNNPK